MQRQKQRPTIPQPDKRLHQAVRTGRQNRRRIALRRHRGLQHQQCGIHTHRRQNRQPRSPPPLRQRQRLSLKKEHIANQQHGKHCGRRLRQHRQGKRRQIHPIPPPTRPRRVHPQPRHAPQRAIQIAPLNHVVHRLRHRRMQSEPRRHPQRQPAVRRRHPHPVEDALREQSGHRQQQQEPDHRAQVKPEHVVSTPQRVIQRQRRCHHRPVRLIRRQHAERRRVREDSRQISQGAHRRVVRHRMEVVEVEAVPERVRVDEKDCQQQQTRRKVSFAQLGAPPPHHSRLSPSA